MDEERFLEIYRARDGMEAHFLSNLLEDAGIDARVVGEGLAMGVGDLPMGWSTMPQIWIAERDADRARTLLKEWEIQKAQRLADGDNRGEFEEGPDAAPAQDG